MQFEVKTADNEIRYFVRWNRDTEKYSKLSIVCENILFYGIYKSLVFTFIIRFYSW